MHKYLFLDFFFEKNAIFNFFLLSSHGKENRYGNLSIVKYCVANYRPINIVNQLC